MTEEAKRLIEVLRNGPVGAAERAEATNEALVVWIESVEERLGFMLAEWTLEPPAEGIVEVGPS